MIISQDEGSNKVESKQIQTQNKLNTLIWMFFKIFLQDSKNLPILSFVASINELQQAAPIPAKAAPPASFAMLFTVVKGYVIQEPRCSGQQNGNCSVV